MKHVSITLCLFLSINLFANKKFLLNDNDTVLILGDSITHGGTYASILDTYLYRNLPKQKFNLIAIGLSSETISGLSEKAHPFPRPNLHTRLDSALEKVKPNVVISCYGMNDGIYHPQSPERMRAFKDGINKLREKCKKAGAILIIMTPPPFDASNKRTFDKDHNNFSFKQPYKNYDNVLKEYDHWLMTLKDKHTIVNLRALFIELSTEMRKTNPKYVYSKDGIHPDKYGHYAMASALIKALNGPVELDINKAAMDKFFKSKHYQLANKRRAILSDSWRTHVGHKRPGVKKGLPLEKALIEAKKLDEVIRALK